MPAAGGGPDTFENAAPLCPNCHEGYGDNPKKRKEIRQMRDWWFEVVAEKYPTSRESDRRLNELIATNDERVIEALEERVTELERSIRDAETEAERRAVASEVSDATRLAQRVYADFQCRRCGARIGLLVGADACPRCGEPIRGG